MQDDPRYDDVVAEVGDELADARRGGGRRGRRPRSDLRRPGDRLRQERARTTSSLLAHLPRLAERTGRPVLVGVSRKRFLATLLGDAARDRTVATVAAGLAALDRGAWGLRVHDVRAARATRCGCATAIEEAG